MYTYVLNQQMQID